MEGKEIGSYIDRTYKAVRQDLTGRFLEAGIDLTPEQWVILSKLDKKKEMSQSELANATFKDKPTVSRILDLMVKKEMVARVVDAADKRKFIIRITPKGSEIIEAARPLVSASRKQGAANISDEEYATLIQLLDRIFTNYS